MLNGLVQVNVELTSRCNKECWFCGRRERDKIYGTGNYGDMDFKLVKKIASQLPKNTIIALHNNGEPLLYPELGSAIKTFKNHGLFVYTVTNGKLLMKKYNDIVNNIDQISISIIEKENSDEQKLQLDVLKEFLFKKKENKPYVVLRYVGNVDESLYKDLNLPIVRRTVHLPKGSVGYRKEPMRPEFLVCWDLMSRLAIDRFGDISLCVRYDPEREIVIGNIENMTIDEAWNSEKRLNIVENMIAGKRTGFCNSKCQFWGIPTA